VKAARSAPFNPKTLPLYEWISNDDTRFSRLRNENYSRAGRVQVISDGTLLPSDFMHCQKRIMDGQWKATTSYRGYLDDLKRALDCHHARLRVRVGRYSKEPNPLRVGYFLTPLGDQGAPLGNLSLWKGMTVFIAYDPEGHCLLTGYLIDTRRVDSYPGEWIDLKEVDL
jgi:hypothetical protein